MKTRKWSDEALAKREEGCRVCGRPDVELAHVTYRRFDRPRKPGQKTVWVEPESIVPLCNHHHRLFDDHLLDLLPYLHLEEELRAIEDMGSIGLALKRLSPDFALNPSEQQRQSQEAMS